MNKPTVLFKSDGVKVPVDLYLELRREMQDKIKFREGVILYLFGGLVGVMVLYLLK
jgi:hypothetical protein